jgi:endonuclease YncB( thermonuclease family)
MKPRGVKFAVGLGTGLALALAAWLKLPVPGPDAGPAAEAGLAGPTFTCARLRVIDGDTFACGQRRVRLQGIDAPELAGHCRPGRRCTPGDGVASRAHLQQLVAWSQVQCRQTDTDVYGRTVARCSAGRQDLSCAQVAAGQAVLRYAPITC